MVGSTTCALAAFQISRSACLQLLRAEQPSCRFNMLFAFSECPEAARDEQQFVRAEVEGGKLDPAIEID